MTLVSLVPRTQYAQHLHARLNKKPLCPMSVCQPSSSSSYVVRYGTLSHFLASLQLSFSLLSLHMYICDLCLAVAGVFWPCKDLELKTIFHVGALAVEFPLGIVFPPNRREIERVRFVCSFSPFPPRLHARVGARMPKCWEKIKDRVEIFRLLFFFFFVTNVLHS